MPGHRKQTYWNENRSTTLVETDSSCRTHGTYTEVPTIHRIGGFDARSAGANAAPRHVHTRVVLVRNLHRNEHLRRHVPRAPPCYRDAR
jgi:hypothetical protein